MTTIQDSLSSWEVMATAGPASHHHPISPRLLSGDPHPGRCPRHPDCRAEEVCRRPGYVCGAWAAASCELVVLHGAKCVGGEGVLLHPGSLPAGEGWAPEARTQPGCTCAWGGHREADTSTPCVEGPCTQSCLTTEGGVTSDREFLVPGEPGKSWRYWR